MPVKEIRRITKDAGVMLLLDGAQTAGHIKLDMKDIDCEFYSIPGQKWLLGPEATGALYIRHDMLEKVSPTQVAGKAVVPDHNPYQIETILAPLNLPCGIVFQNLLRWFSIIQTIRPL